MSAKGLEDFLARIYVEAAARQKFLADPDGEARRAGLDPSECDAVQKIDRVGLAMAARSFERKRALSREHLPCRRKWSSLLPRFLQRMFPFRGRRRKTPPGRWLSGPIP